MDEEPYSYHYPDVPGEEEMLYWATFTPPSPELLLDELIATPPPAVAVIPTSAFRRYGETQQQLSHCIGSGKNAHKRVIEFLKALPMPKAEKDISGISNGMSSQSRGFMHMMRERCRRERQSQSYADLYSMVTPKSKADKNSIVQSSTVYMKKLKATESILRRRNQELKARTTNKEARKPEGTKSIKLRVGNPVSSIDSMVASLQCLKGMDVKATAIHFTFSIGELSAAINIETEMAAEEVERSAQSVLVRVEKQMKRQQQQPLRTQYLPRTIGWTSKLGNVHVGDKICDPEV